MSTSTKALAALVRIADENEARMNAPRRHVPCGWVILGGMILVVGFTIAAFHFGVL